jgi:TfoX/Sxy family transcriptional regulator of competence genes
MASNIDFVNYVVDQIRDVGIITFKKMFGEYLIYANQKPVVLIVTVNSFHWCNF